ncbi:Polyketide cyclase/dehydrase [Macleaya cordata]|uniref:Polyketide cyclase/dehydrase n=1 Tax=Macleaya cordata TaxID=56857 RepID=A0A200RBZ2_MACCD|nr:Polyketide cyclase/dehydrase [Macleaya cordata]
MESEGGKWEGKVSAKVRGATADQVWPLIQDFFNLNKWYPTLKICNGIEGVSGQPGCVRYCSGFSIPAVGSDKDTINWCHEKLVSIDPVQRSLTYVISDGNIGFNSYVATWNILPDDEGCLIDWSFSVDPVQGWRVEDLVTKFDTGLHNMTSKIEEAFNTK